MSRIPCARRAPRPVVPSSRRPGAPCDPASGSLTGGARCGWGGKGAMESDGLVFAYEAYQGWLPPYGGATHGAVFT